MQNRDTSVPGMAPTHTRYWVIFFAVTLSIISYFDRVCISKAAPYITDELGFSKVQMGWVFAAFSWCYALFEIPSGWLGDKIGARKVLMRIVLWWSFFTAATGWAWNLTTMIMTRALFGMGEAGCFPNITKSFMTWLTPHERVRAHGIMWLCARWGGAITPLVVAGVLEYVSWRRAFELFACFGIIWAFFFYRWYKDNPRDNPKVNAAELALMPKAEDLILGHGKIPWLKMIQSPTVWGLWIQYFCMNYPWIFYVTWLPTYLSEERHVEAGMGALLAGFPLFFGGIGSFFCGLFLPYLSRQIANVTLARRLIAMSGLLGASLMFCLFPHIGNPVLGMLILGMASFGNDLAMPPSWAACMDVGGKFAGTLSGSMNMIGNFGAAVGALAIGYILRETNQNWNIIFYVSSVVYFIGFLSWLMIDPVTPIKSDTPEELQSA